MSDSPKLKPAAVPQPVAPTPSPQIDFVNFLNAVDNAKADSVNPGFKRGDRASRYASLAEVLDTIKAAATVHNIAVRQIPETEDKKFTITTVFVHKDGTTWTGGKIGWSMENPTPQSFGSALSYYRRYSLMTAAGIATEDDTALAVPAAVIPPPRPASPFAPRPTA